MTRPAIHRPLNVLSLFSGAGGMDRGLEAAGYNHVGFVEIDATATATLRDNRPSWAQLGTGDILELADQLTPASLGLEASELDLIAGGLPCQPFSLAAQWATRGRRGMLDPRALTVHATMKIVRRFLPRAILMENVPGSVRGEHSALRYLATEFDDIHRTTGFQYTLHWKMVNSADYGVPQNRKRAIIVATRDATVLSWHSPTHLEQPVPSWDVTHDRALHYASTTTSEPISGSIRASPSRRTESTPRWPRKRAISAQDLEANVTRSIVSTNHRRTS